MKDEFLDPFVTESVEPGVAEMVRPFRFASARLGKVVRIPEGFRHDWDSVPRKPGLHALLKGRAEISAGVHDFLYATGMFSRKTSDRVFLDAMKVEGVKRRYRWPIYAGVRLGGWVGWRRHRNGEVKHGK